MRYLLGLAAMLVVVGCAEVKARPERVAAVTAKPAGLKPKAMLRGALVVGDVFADPTDSALSIQVFDNNILRLALEASIQNAGLKGEGRSPYKLNARLLKIDQPIVFLNPEVTVTIGYEVLETSTGVSIYSRVIPGTYEASFNDEADGTARLQLAHEFAARQSIDAMIADLQAIEKK